MSLYDNTAEQTLLRFMLFNQDQFKITKVQLRPQTFFVERNRIIFEKMLEIDEKGDVPDILNVSLLLSNDHQNYLKEQVIQNAPGTLTPKPVIEKLHDLETRRRLKAKHIQALEKIDDLDIGVEEVIFDQRQTALDEIKGMSERPTHISHHADRTIENLDKAAAGNAEWFEYPFPEITKFIDIVRGDLHILAGETGGGKSSLAAQYAYHNATRGYTVAIVSLEMGEEELIRRIATQLTGESGRAARKGTLNEKQLTTYKAKIRELKSLPIHFLNSSVSKLPELCLELEKIKLKFGLDTVVVDHLNLVEAPGANNIYQRVSEVTRTLKIVSGPSRLDVGTVLVCQYNREMGGNRPKLRNLAGGSVIEQNGNSVVLLWNDAQTDPTVVTVLCEKNRDGDRGESKLAFLKTQVAFRSLSAHQENGYVHPQDQMLEEIF